MAQSSAKRDAKNSNEVASRFRSGALSVKMVIGRRSSESQLRHGPLHGFHCRRHDEYEEYWAFTCPLTHSNPILHLHLFIAKLEVDKLTTASACKRVTILMKWSGKP